MKIFLGGTCNGSTWRDELIPHLDVDYFNPVVKDWTPNDQQKEIEERENCDYVLYVISPEMKGVYSIAEAVHDSLTKPKGRTLFYIHNEEGFDKTQLKSLYAVGNLINNNGGIFVQGNFDFLFKYINSRKTLEMSNGSY